MRCGDVLPTSRHRGALLEAHTIVVRTPLTAHRAQRLRLRLRCDCGCVTAAAWLWLWLWLWLTADSGTTTPARSPSPSPALRGKLRFQLDSSSPTGEDHLAFQLPCPLGALDKLASVGGQRPNEKRRASRRFFCAPRDGSSWQIEAPPRQRCGSGASPYQARLPTCSERPSNGADGALSTAVHAWSTPIPRSSRAHLMAAQPFCQPLRAMHA